MTWYANDFFYTLRIAGEDTVRKKLAQGDFPPQKIPLVQEWLRQREEARQVSSLSRQEERDTEANALVREANDIARSARDEAREANSIARFARIMAIIATIIAAISIVKDIIIAIL